ncbi:MAG TPA: Gfo/Idh/MocA family oxidoreductase [Cyclobacteriaceae bacterium]|nr:Gfo/Idh/MocA family oxidoreductase [Cyclobacteriaceae bacterium]
MENVSRRSFLQKMGLGAGVVSLVTLPSFLSHEKRNYQGKKLNIALCGLGRYAGYLAEGITVSQYCKVAGIVTGTPTKEKIWSEKYGIPQSNIYNYNNFDEIRNNGDIDLVYVVLPNAMHKEFAIRAAKAGKHVIVEKPMAINASDCQEMIDVCKKANVQLAVGYRLHYEPYNMELKRLGQEKVLGQVRLVEASLGYKSGTPGEWRLNKALAGGGPLMNLGVYCVQVARYILGEEPVSVTAQFGPVTNKELFKEVEESITWQLHFPGGAAVTSTSSYNCGIDRVYAGADEGFFELSPAISYGPFKGRTSKGELNFPEINQQATQCDEIAKVLLAGNELPDHITGQEGWKDAKVMDGIYKAAETGRRVSLV